ncbi:MAG: ABC transporter permease [Proteobacteria bacterium]|jgi:putative spermidine/putrescine transport system permease protein|nr:ABC transporter permease [Pseudomonadota bacterium]
MSTNRTGAILLWIYACLVLAFLIVPVLIVIPVSFSPGISLKFPPQGISMRWYRNFFDDPAWTSAAWLSVKVAFMTVVASLVLGGAAAFGLERYSVRGAGFVRGLLMTPLFIPAVVIAVAVYSVYASLRLIGSTWGVAIAHTVLALPYVIIMLAAGIGGIDKRLEEASYSMGATRAYTFRRIQVPLLAPTIVAAAIFAFAASWDEVILVLFVGGTTAQTLPLKMFTYLRTEISPTIAAISAMMVCLILVIYAVAELVKWRASRRRAAR